MTNTTARETRPKGGAQRRAAGAFEAERSGVEKQLIKRMRALGPMPNLVGGVPGSAW